jgi:hypothetical protein
MFWARKHILKLLNPSGTGLFFNAVFHGGTIIGVDILGYLPNGQRLQRTIWPAHSGGVH